MRPLRALIVDDEAPARAKLHRLLSASAGVTVGGEAATGREAVAAIKRVLPDIVFLDIQMPGLDGFGVLDALRNDVAPYVVFVTADDRQAIRAFEAGVVDYLLKPFTRARFEQVMERARDRLGARQVGASSGSPAPLLERLLVSQDGSATFVSLDAVDWISSDRNYVELHLHGARHRVRSTIQAIMERLDAAEFLRINRSTIVRLDAVATMTQWSHGDYRVVLRDGTELVWSRRFKADAERLFGVRRPRKSVLSSERAEGQRAPTRA